MVSDKLVAYTSGAYLGADWLCRQQKPDGSIGKEHGIAAMYKVVLALVNSGRIGAVNALLTWTRDNLMTGPGEFHNSDETDWDRTQWAYRNILIMLGAYKAGRYDIVSKAAFSNIFDNYMHPSGGFLGNPDRKITPLINLLVTDVGGWLSMACGRYDLAIKTGDFLVRMLDDQPEIEKKLYVQYDPSKDALVTDAPDEISENSYFIDNKKPVQHFYHCGTTAGFLTELFEATGLEKYLDAAKGYMDFTMSITEDSYDWPSKCKEGWGAAQVYRVTRDPRHRDVAEKVAERTFLQSIWREADHWGACVIPLGDYDIQLTNTELTSEFVWEMMEIVKGLGSVPENSSI